MPLHRLLIVGVGSIGERHLRCFLATGRVEVAFIEINDELRKRIGARYAVPGFRTWEEAAAIRPTAAVVAVPAHLHVQFAMGFVNEGLHVLIEKPLSTEMTGVHDLQQLVTSRRVAAGVAYVNRCHPILGALHQILRQDRFGAPLELIVVAGQHFPTYRPAYREIYYKDRATGGGAIQDALTHLLNAGEWLVGKITRLVVDAEHLALPGVTVEDTVHVLARHGSVLASYALNQHQAPNEITFTVVCERGTIRAEYHRSRWMWCTEPGAEWQIESMEALERDAIFIAQAHAFLDQIEGRENFPCSLADGIQTLRVNLAALASLESGSWQSVS